MAGRATLAFDAGRPLIVSIIGSSEIICCKCAIAYIGPVLMTAFDNRQVRNLNKLTHRDVPPDVEKGAADLAG
jgi:hypothetical protein